MSSTTTLHDITDIRIQQVTLKGANVFYSTRIDCVDSEGHTYSLSALSAQPIEIKHMPATTYEEAKVAA